MNAKSFIIFLTLYSYAKGGDSGSLSVGDVNSALEGNSKELWKSAILTEASFKGDNKEGTLKGVVIINSIWRAVSSIVVVVGVRLVN